MVFAVMFAALGGAAESSEPAGRGAESAVSAEQPAEDVVEVALVALRPRPKPRKMSSKPCPPPAPPGAVKRAPEPMARIWSYSARWSLSDSTEYASLISLNRASAFTSPALESGWCCRASLR